MAGTNLKPRLVALEAGNLDEALAFYGAVFQFSLRGRAPGMAFIDMGDQFLALSEGRSQAPDTDRHFCLVVDDPWQVRDLTGAAGARIASGKRLEILDQWCRKWIDA